MLPLTGMATVKVRTANCGNMGRLFDFNWQRALCFSAIWGAVVNQGSMVARYGSRRRWYAGQQANHGRQVRAGLRNSTSVEPGVEPVVVGDSKRNRGKAVSYASAKARHGGGRQRGNAFHHLVLTPIVILMNV